MRSKVCVAVTIALTVLTLGACRSGTSAKVQQAVWLESMASSGGTRTITEADAAGVAHTINDGEIQLAQLALTNASSQQVRDFAQMMITDHTNANQMLEQQGMSVVRNRITDVLNAQVNDAMGRLRSRTGADFDREYIATQIELHQVALDTVNDVLIPSATEKNLRSTLGTILQSVQTHLEHARSIQGSLGR